MKKSEAQQLMEAVDIAKRTSEQLDKTVALWQKYSPRYDHAIMMLQTQRIYYGK